MSNIRFLSQGDLDFSCGPLHSAHPTPQLLNSSRGPSYWAAPSSPTGDSAGIWQPSMPRQGSCPRGSGVRQTTSSSCGPSPMTMMWGWCTTPPPTASTSSLRTRQRSESTCFFHMRTPPFLSVLLVLTVTLTPVVQGPAPNWSRYVTYLRAAVEQFHAALWRIWPGLQRRLHSHMNAVGRHKIDKYFNW